MNEPWPKYDTYDLIESHEFFKHWRKPEPAKLQSDSYFQTGAINMVGGTSELLEDATAYMENQLSEDFGGLNQVIEDIIWEVAGQVLAWTVGAFTGGTGYFVTSLLWHGLMAAMGVEEQLNIEAYNNLKGVNTKDEVTLSDKHGIDSMVGGLISNPLSGGQQGIYARVQTQVGNTPYVGEIILKPHGVSAATGFNPFAGEVTGFEELSSYDYATRNYMFLSKQLAKDAHEWNIIYGKIAPFIGTDDNRYSYMENTIPYLEDMISQNTGGTYNTVVMKEIDGHPAFSFAHSGSGTPNYYEDFPVLVSSESYDILKSESYDILKSESYDILKSEPLTQDPLFYHGLI